MNPIAIGVDFGTTNSVVAIADASGAVVARRFDTPAGPVDAYRSALLFFREGRPPHAKVRHVSGPAALDRALDIDGEHRFLQSLKTYVSSPAFQDTRLFGKKFLIEDLIGVFLADILPAELSRLPIVSGRPVVFAGERANETLALERMTAAYRNAGVETVDFAYEPFGAAYTYGRTLTRPETVLVADFGGGTSDFSVMRFNPAGGRLEANALSHAGVGVAGDTFDFRLIDNLVSPRLGRNSVYRSFEKQLPMPARYYAAFAQWHKLSLLKSADTMAQLRRLAKDAEKPEEIEHLIEIVDHDLGYELYVAVSKLKAQLSASDHAPFRFAAGGLCIETEVARADFERWIAEDVASMEATVDLALERAGAVPDDIDAVFLTGGTSFVPAVRNLFASRFGADKLRFGDAFASVACGLALVAADRARQSD
ncbi:hsp70 family protein [Rhodoblastus sphagnicola]|uniref:Hsp70 family protein n=1 Tax=Rhodoblastus sphagnicola TaxID=333368 RepID=A0A2S6NFZ3_9HYPH|nr:Hsp70 family protein [Rhodoblastus sphagnicola]MBB4199468.1 putative chaperone protein [Rhodoblastus sphagnicola]PPQ33562.1 hsp70 family protein [Rhodoblastus sphagnicola]